MKNVFMLPWVGELYSKKGYKNKKIMILGESYYCDREYCGCRRNDCSASIKDPCDLRKEVIDRYVKYIKNRKKSNVNFEKWFNTYTKFTNLLIGKNGEKCDDETIVTFWKSILFYNYVQQPLNKPREAPSDEMFKDEKNKDGFFEIIKKYDPDVIFAWGKRLWPELPNDNFSYGKSILSRPSGLYNNGKREIPIFYVNHPSSGKNYDLTKKYLKKAMAII